MPIHGNLLDNLPSARRGAGDEEVFESLARIAGGRIERIVSTGQASPQGFWYDQDEDELVVVLRGAASIEIEDEDEPIELVPGGWALLPAHCRHRVAWTSEDEPTIWLAVFFRG